MKKIGERVAQGALIGMKAGAAIPGFGMFVSLLASQKNPQYIQVAGMMAVGTILAGGGGALLGGGAGALYGLGENVYSLLTAIRPQQRVAPVQIQNGMVPG